MPMISQQPQKSQNKTQDQQDNILRCKKTYKNYAGEEKICAMPYSLASVYIILPDNTKHCICRVVYCVRCHSFLKDKKARPFAVGAWINKADYKLFDIPRAWWLGDWPWRQKFAWEAISLLAEYDTRGFSDFEIKYDDVVARIGCQPVENKDYNYDVAEIFGRNCGEAD